MTVVPLRCNRQKKIQSYYEIVIVKVSSFSQLRQRRETRYHVNNRTEILPRAWKDQRIPSISETQSFRVESN